MAVKCPVCNEREASDRYHRVNHVTEEVERLCRTCWLALRHSGKNEWTYYKEAVRTMLLYSVLPLLVLGLLVWLLVIWLS